MQAQVGERPGRSLPAIEKTIRPIFLFSISRSGSTLVQRVIAAHDGVATVSEPQLLLPQLYLLRREGVVADYGHLDKVTALEDFCEELPAGTTDYLVELRNFVLRLYRKAAGPDAGYFLDKSVPYYWVADEIMRVFPEGKFIFLWRNPLSVVASITETWLDGRWNPGVLFHQRDLFVGLPRLVSTYLANASSAYAVRFEDLVVGDQRHWEALTKYVGLKFDALSLRSFARVGLNGRMGDPIGVRRYSSLSLEPMQKWKATISNPLRRAWCRRYVEFLGDERLAVMGYDKERLLCELASQPPNLDAFAMDLARLAKYLAREPVRSLIRHREMDRPSFLRELLAA
jgi:Sulfotransferase family